MTQLLQLVHDAVTFQIQNILKFYQVQENSGTFRFHFKTLNLYISLFLRSSNKQTSTLFGYKDDTHAKKKSSSSVRVSDTEKYSLAKKFMIF